MSQEPSDGVLVPVCSAETTADVCDVCGGPFGDRTKLRIRTVSGDSVCSVNCEGKTGSANSPQTAQPISS